MAANSIAQAVLTWLVVCYVVLSEKISPLHSFYHIIAVITLDALMLVLWLSAWALTAARRGTIAPLMKVANRDGSQKCDDPDSYFDYYGSYNDDCAGQKTIKEYKWRGDAGAAIAGLGALEWYALPTTTDGCMCIIANYCRLLFIATFSWTLVAYVRTHSTSQNQSSIQMGTRNVKIPAEQTGDFVQNQHTSEPNLYRR